MAFIGIARPTDYTWLETLPRDEPATEGNPMYDNY
jgi:hypothetical protein